MIQSLEEEFGPIRSFFWPIHRHEYRKIIPMLLMLFLICFNYSVLKCMKDSVVITASGAEVIPFIKVWVLLPVAVLLTYVFTKLSNRYSQERVFYIIISGFLIFFALFAFVLYPLQAYIHPHGLAERLELVLPNGFYGLIEMCRYWSFTAFYVLAEIWGSMVLTVLFWGFANEITAISEAQRYYAVLTVVANISAIIAGFAGLYLSTGGMMNPSLPFGKTGWEQTLMILVFVVELSGLAIMGIFWWMNRNVLNDPCFDELHETKLKNKKKKLSLRDSFSFLSNSKYIAYIAVIVVGYNLVINLTEVVWKDQLRLLYPETSDYHVYMNYLTIGIGAVSTVMAFFMARFLDRFGWTITALITPITILATSVGFFGFLFFQVHLEGVVFSLFGTTPLVIAVMIGGIQNCLCKASKYSVFDATKEMAFIPLEHDVKLKGKAAIDGVGSRFGKSGGSLIHQGLLFIFGNLNSSTSIVAFIITVVTGYWTVAVRSLGKQFGEKLVSDKVEGVEEQPATA